MRADDEIAYVPGVWQRCSERLLLPLRWGRQRVSGRGVGYKYGVWVFAGRGPSPWPSPHCVERGDRWARDGEEEAFGCLQEAAPPPDPLRTA